MTKQPEVWLQVSMLNVDVDERSYICMFLGWKGLFSGSSNDAPNSPARRSLKKIPPYWYPYRTNAKARWFDREILEVVSTEFRDRSVEYYVRLFNFLVTMHFTNYSG